MMIDSNALAALSDEDLLTTVKTCGREERRATVQLIAALAELDARKLYLAEGYSSLFAYCTQVLHLSEHAAYGRIEAARVLRRSETTRRRPLLTVRASHVQAVEGADGPKRSGEPVN